MGGPQAFVWLAHPLRGHLPSPRFEWWGYANTSLCPPSQKNARSYVPDATSLKRARELRRPSCHSYSPEYAEEDFSGVLLQDAAYPQSYRIGNSYWTRYSTHSRLLHVVVVHKDAL